MGRAAQVAFTLVASVFASSACSLLVGTGELTGNGGDAGATADAIASDAPSGDASASSDAGASDAGLDATWCARNYPDATYCADFDDGRPLSALGIVNGEVRIEPNVGSNGSSALLADLPDAPDAALAWVHKDLFGSGAVFEVEFKARIAKKGSNEYTEAFYLIIPYATTDYRLLVALNDSVNLQEERVGSSAHTFTNIPMDLTVPVKVWVQLDTSPSPWRVKMRVNDQDVLDAPTWQAPPSVASQVTVLYGAVYSAPSTPKQLVIDDVSVVRR